MNYNLHILLKAWHNCLNSLIDFDSGKSASLTISVDCSGSLYNRGNSLQFVKSGLRQESRQGEFVVEMKSIGDIYELIFGEDVFEQDPELEETPWMIIRDVFSNSREGGYKLREGDVIKMGKFHLKVRQIKLKNENNTKTMIESKMNALGSLKENDNDMSNQILNKIKDDFQKSRARDLNQESISNMLLLNNNTIQIQQHNKVKTLNKPECRICFSDEYDASNPLINPCKCSGTSKYIHLSCLKQLISSKIITKSTESVVIHQFKSLECEVCKTLLPEKVKIRDQIISVIELHRPDSNYMILEGILKENNDMHCIYIVQINDHRPIKIGRASDADLRLWDISVSRSHALLSFYNGAFYLSDSKSKFGTLVSVTKHLCVIPGKPLSLQIGKNSIRFSLRKKFWAFISCYQPKNLIVKSYNDYLEKIKLQSKQPESPQIIWTETHIVSEFNSIDNIEENPVCNAKEIDENFQIQKNTDEVKKNNQSFTPLNDHLCQIHSKASAKSLQHLFHPSIHLNINIQVNNPIENHEQKPHTKENIPTNVKSLADGFFNYINPSMNEQSSKVIYSVREEMKNNQLIPNLRADISKEMKMAAKEKCDINPQQQNIVYNPSRFSLDNNSQ